MAKATYDDLVKIPEDQVAEMVDGALHASPRPRLRHAHVIGALHATLRDAFQDRHSTRGGWWFLIEPEVHLGEDVYAETQRSQRRGSRSAPPRLCVRV